MKKIIYILVMLVVMFSFCELAFRIAGFYPALPLISDKPGVQAYYWVCDENLGWRNRANGVYDYDLIAANPHSSTDRNGFRNGIGWNDSTTNPIVLFVGDSFVFGAEVNDDQTFCSEIAEMLPNMRILNAGVRGYSTVQSKRMMEQCLDLYSNNIAAVVYVYCGNDVQENVNTDAYAPVKSPIAVLNKNTSVLSEISVTNPPVSWGNDFVALMEKGREEKYARIRNKRWDRRFRDKIKEHSAFLNALNELVGRGRTSPAHTVTGSGADNDADDAKNDYARDVLIALMQEMDKECNERDIPFVVTSATTSGNLQGIDKWCDIAGVDFIDVSAGFTKSQFYYMARRRDRVYDSHYNPRGTKAFAEEFTPQFLKVVNHREHKDHIDK